MIEIVLDFKNLDTDYDLERLLHKKLFGISLPEKQNTIRGFRWDSFTDSLRTMLYKEWDEYNEEDWKSYTEYLKGKEEDAAFGVKNEKGVRDDMKLIFINFKAFSLRQKGLSAMFLEVLFETIKEQNSDEWRIDGMMNDLEICIKS